MFSQHQQIPAILRQAFPLGARPMQADIREGRQGEGGRNKDIAGGIHDVKDV